MKKIIVLFVLMILGIGSMSAKNATGVSNKIISLAGQYKHYDEFEVVKIGPLFMKLLKWTADDVVDADDEEALALIDGVKKFVVVEYDDADQKVKDEFSAKVSKILEKSEVLMEAKDDGDLVKIYGNISDDGNLVSDLVLFVPSDCALICISGTVAMKEVKNIMDMGLRKD